MGSWAFLSPGASRVVWSPFLPWGLSSSTGVPGRQGEPGKARAGEMYWKVAFGEAVETG